MDTVGQQILGEKLRPPIIKHNILGNNNTFTATQE
jgi:hypothetical protein